MQFAHKVLRLSSKPLKVDHVLNPCNTTSKTTILFIFVYKVKGKGKAKESESP
jgi:hypothetical protein